MRAVGLRVSVANYCRSGSAKALKDIIKEKPVAVGLSVFSHNRHVSLRLAVRRKKELPDTCVILGGAHATFLAEEIIRRYRMIDCIIRGEGEIALRDTVRHLLQGNRPAQKIIDGIRVDELDTLPPAYSFTGPMSGVDVNEQFKYIITSRGCPHHCTYCCSPAFWGRRTTFRSAIAMADMVEHLYREYGIIYFSIRDDNFTLKRERVLDFCREIRARGIFPMWNCQSREDTIDLEMIDEMKKSGMEHIQFGVESGSPAILKQYDKVSIPVRWCARPWLRACRRLSFGISDERYAWRTCGDVNGRLRSSAKPSRRRHCLRWPGIRGPHYIIMTATRDWLRTGLV